MVATIVDSHRSIASIFGVPRALIGVIHLEALPGTPQSRHPIATIVDAAVAEAECYANAGFHGIMIENTRDRPYIQRIAGPEIIAAMAVVAETIRRTVSIPLGVQVLAGANTAALAVAHASGAAFIRAEGFVFAHVADEGLFSADAGPLFRYRRSIGAESVRVFVDVKKKHSAHAITADMGIEETAKAAEFFLADGVVVTGVATGEATDPGEVGEVSRAVTIPTLVGSGLTPENIGRYPGAEGLIVGSWVKQQGLWSNPLDPGRVRTMAESFAATGISGE
jgi:membrane complex biogenesis BtpA family protein